LYIKNINLIRSKQKKADNEMKGYLHFIWILLTCVSSALGQVSTKGKIDEFVTKTGAIPTIDKATNSLNFLRFPAGHALKLDGITTREKAFSFLKQNGSLFALKQDDDTFSMKKTETDTYGKSHVIMQQHFKGVPVWDGTLKFHFNKNNELTVLNGNFVQVEKLATEPTITREQAENAALKMVTGQKMGNFKAPLKVNKSTLYIFQKGLAQGYKGQVYLVYEVEVRNDVEVREFLYVDAHTKELVEQFTGMHEIDRKLYETSVSGGNLKWQESNGIPSTAYDNLDVWQKSEVDVSGQIYNLMNNTFGQLSYNNADATMITINNNPTINCPNANWNGVTANYCTGIAADDVVAHEWGHAYTEYTSGLIYAWQPGALNEAYSDIWGETVDQLNGYMDTGETVGIRSGCTTKARWLIGEQASALSSALRDMWDPNCKNDPGKVTDPLYWCSSSDAGGVHTNSGVLNHAYALLVDGGTYNGQTITGLGLTKAAHIFWYAQKNYMTSTTDFAAIADILEMSLEDLIDADLLNLTVGPAAPGLYGQVITRADAGELSKVIAAVELRLENNCNFQRILSPVAAICAGGSASNALFFADFEAGIGSWTVSNLGENITWQPRDWVVTNSAPGGRTGKVLFAVDYLGGNCGSDQENGVMSLLSPVISISSTQTGALTMAFDHYVATEAGYDGGNIKYKIDAGAWTLVPFSAFLANGYNMTLSTLGQGSNNPLRGQVGFSGTDEGSITGSWGQSQINLTALGLDPGETIQFRWDFGTDGCGGIDGWYIDDVRVYTCAVTSVQFATSATSVNEGEATIASEAPNACLKYIEKTVTVKINKAPAQPVTVNLTASPITATQGSTSDFTFSPTSVVLDAGTLSSDIVVRIFNDAAVEGNESFTLSYTLTNAPGGDAFADSQNQTHTVTIVDDDLGPEYTKTLIAANFNQGLPVGWNVVGGGNYPSTWGVVQFNEVALDPAGRPLLIINSYAAGVGLLDKSVDSESFNTVGMLNLNLTFIENFLIYNESDDLYDEEAMVDVWDGSAWHTLLTQNETTGSSGSWTTPAIRNINIPIAYANPAMKIRFRYIGNYDYYWAIDNVTVSGTYSKAIQSAVSVSADNQYLGPNAIVYFYDPTSGNVMTKIQNLSAHDYGCTSVEVDRAGLDDVAWVNSYRITQKTLKVTPTNNNSTGNYKITLFYNTAELPNFNNSQIKSIGKSAGSIATATSIGSSFKTTFASPANGTNLAYIATFETGFSGFGLSNATPPALPVTLSYFAGKNVPEGNLLEWITTYEDNNRSFTVERAADSRNFTSLGLVNGIGNNTLKSSYRFIDTNPLQGSNYYRLRQTDFDDKVNLSRIIEVNAGIANTSKFFPNPVTGQLSVEIPDKTANQINVQILNVSGRVVMTKHSVEVINGIISCDLSQLPVGIYQVILSAGGRKYQTSVLKE
jgi:Zn-dependent metalloprotease